MTALTSTQIANINKSSRAMKDGTVGTRIAALEAANPGSTIMPAAEGVAEASKLLQLGTNKNVDTIVVADGGLKLGSGAGTAVTATAAELNYSAGVTPGTVTASKTLMVNGSKQLNELGIAGTLTITTVGAITMGTLSSANDLSGVALTASKSKAFAINADTGGSALTAGFVRAGVSRFLLGTAITSGADISTVGHEGLLKSIVSVNVGGNQAGVLGHYETAGTLTLTGSINTVKAGVASFLDIATGGTVAAGSVVSAFGVNPANFGTVTGRSAIIHVTNPMSGTWGSFLDLSTATGCTQDAAAGSTGGKHLKVYINGVLYTIAMVTA
jgi:hypothetical protein